jgi:hypothetical protein
MTDKSKNLGIRGTPAQHHFLRELALKTGKSVQRLVEDALRYTYENADKMPTPPSVPPRHLHAHALLEEVLESGDQKVIEWITGNLKMFAEALQARNQTRPARKGGIGS